jgi:predicted flap endonuclease-1-like 5' DNA nuclease
LATSTPAPFSSSLSSLPPSVACAASSRRNSSSSAATSSSSSPHPPPLRTVPGIGAKAELLLAAAGIGTVADLVRAFEARAASSKPQMVSFLQVGG